MQLNHYKGNKYRWYNMFTLYHPLKVLWIGNWRLYYGMGKDRYLP